MLYCGLQPAHIPPYDGKSVILSNTQQDREWDFFPLMLQIMCFLNSQHTFVFPNVSVSSCSSVTSSELCLAKIYAFIQLICFVR